MRIRDDNSIGLIVDIQARLLPHMVEPDRVVAATVTLIRGLRTLGIPVFFTEQYPKGLGSTVEGVAAEFAGEEPIIKASFSCCDDNPFRDRLAQSGKKSVILAGIEAHVCMLQTAIDLVDQGYQPVIVADATSSRSTFDRDIAFERMRQEGARISTVESILFELTRVSGTPRFKEISRLIK